MQDARREILTQVAAGTLTPTEAATRLEEVERTGPDARPAQQESSTGTDVRGVRISNSYGRIVVIGDSAVAQATVEGPHVARTEDGIFVIETDQRYEGDYWFGQREGGHWWDSLRGPTLTVRINPRLETWINADAGTVSVSGVLAPIHAEVQAGSIVVKAFVGPLDLLAQAGSIRGEGSLKSGASSIRCEMGSIRLALAPDSDVRVSALANMGKVSLDNGTSDPTSSPRWAKRLEAVYGSGAASLSIESEMGSVTVSRQ